MDELKEYLAEKPEVTSKAPEVTEKIVEVINMTYFPNITVSLTTTNVTQPQPTNVTITRSGIGIFSRGTFL